MASFKFYPYKQKGKCKVYVRISLKRGKDFRLSTTLTIAEASSWDYKKDLPKKSTEENKNLHSSLINLENDIDSQISQVERSYESSINDITSKNVRQMIRSHFNETPKSELDFLIPFSTKFANDLNHKTYMRYGRRNVYKKNTIDKYKNFTKQLEKYENYIGNKIKVQDVDEQFANSFLEYLSTELDRAINTKGRFVKRLKTIISTADSEGYKVSPSYKNIKGFEDEVMVTFLTFDELDEIRGTKMPTKRLKIAQDWLIIACYTAQRISDLYRMNKKLIINEGGTKYITFRQFKTKVKVKVPVHYKVDAILKKYGGDFPPNILENENSNRATLSKLMKKVCQLAGITEKVEGRYNGKKGIYPKYKLIHNHSCRRSFACNFDGLPGWNRQLIMAITGHKNERNYLRYVDKENDYLSNQVAKLFEEMRITDQQKNRKLGIVRKI